MPGLFTKGAKEMKPTHNLFLFAILAVSCISCRDFDYSGEGNDVPTQGEIRMGVDYGDTFVVNELLSLFYLDYPKAVITTRYMCEVNLLRQLELGELSFVVMNRDLSSAEKENLEKKDIKIRSAMVGKTSIALVVNPNNPVKQLSQAQLRSILAGELKGWENLGHKGDIRAVFDGGCGSNYSYFRNKWFKTRAMSSTLTEKKTPREVLEYVASNDQALGFVSLNWLADRTDSSSVALVKKIKVIAVENPEKKGYFLPFQSQIAAKEYPFIQEIYMHDLQGYSGLAQGFIAYVASQPGQILMKKSGLIPAHDMGRMIELTEE
jgi:phosphate transport system substrate-binding protein